ncbi:hypothetical protein K523DRAFT_326509 [Schizophyllum commune Tattone D]|nr:hypothetical protein K523DRAFT_326509 [Schizophyllum commune Tattone D]
MLLITACCMYARYLATVSAFGKAYRDVHGPDPSSSGESIADRHHLMAERAGYPAGAARRFFDALVRDKKLIYRRVVLGIPFPELSTVERLNFTEDQLSVNEWYGNEYGVSSMIASDGVPAPACAQCLRSRRHCSVVELHRNGCVQCTVRSRRCSLLNDGQAGLRQNMAYGLEELSSVASQLNRVARAPVPSRPQAPI